jgi:hypothetical protein
MPSTRPTWSTTAATCTSAWVPAPPVTGMACSAILGMTSPSPWCQFSLVPVPDSGEGEAAGPGAARTKHFRDTEGQAPTWSRTSPAGGSHPPASPGLTVRRQDTRSAVSYAQGQDRDQRQDPASMREGCHGPPEDNPCEQPPAVSRPTILKEVLRAASRPLAGLLPRRPTGAICADRIVARRPTLPMTACRLNACSSTSAHAYADHHDGRTRCLELRFFFLDSRPCRLRVVFRQPHPRFAIRRCTVMGPTGFVAGRSRAATRVGHERTARYVF